MQSLSALRPGEKLENGIYLAVSAAVIFLLLSIIRTPLGWDAAAEAQAIILTTPILAALLYFSRRDEHRAYGIIRKMMLKSEVELESFVLKASYLLKTWESTVALGSRPEDEMTNTVWSVGTTSVAVFGQREWELDSE